MINGFLIVSIKIERTKKQRTTTKNTYQRAGEKSTNLKLNNSKMTVAATSVIDRAKTFSIKTITYNTIFIYNNEARIFRAMTALMKYLFEVF